MAAELIVKYTLPNSTAPRMKIISHCQTIGQLIAFIVRTHGADVGTVSVDSCILNVDDPLDAFYDSPNQIFAFSKSASRSLVTC
jgi:hypothetical protein